MCTGSWFQALGLSSAASKLNYFVENTSLVVSAPGRSVNSAIEMTACIIIIIIIIIINVNNLLHIEHVLITLAKQQSVLFYS